MYQSFHKFSYSYVVADYNFLFCSLALTNSDKCEF